MKSLMCVFSVVFVECVNEWAVSLSPLSLYTASAQHTPARCRILESRPWFGNLQAWRSPFWLGGWWCVSSLGSPEGSAWPFSRAGWVSCLRDWTFKKTVSEPSSCGHGRFLVTALLSVLSSDLHTSQRSRVEVALLGWTHDKEGSTITVAEDSVHNRGQEDRPGWLGHSPSGPNVLARIFLPWDLLPRLNLEIFLRMNRLGCPPYSPVSGILGLLAGMNSFWTES